tara:strand:+ start:64449 stop:65534 length:1086 start_codon:yes stop_codon:yes gene_type:complete
MNKITTHTAIALVTNQAFFLFVAAYVICTLGFIHYHGLSDRFSIFMYIKPATLQFIPVGMIFYAIYTFHIMIKIQPKNLFLYMFFQLKSSMTSYVFIRGVLTYLAICIFLSTMTSFKFLIPEINPFSWDPALDNFDRKLHGGYAPWEILQPFLDQPIITRFIDMIYAFWFIAMLTVLVWFIFLSKNEILRKRFLLSYLIAWTVNGTILAFIFSSVGPAFYENIYPDINNPYHGLMVYLNVVNSNYPLLALEAQQLLWGWHSSGAVGTGGGISSMPSMHISIATLILFVCWRTNRVAFRLFGAIFLLLILLGSVHLGWHYAIDGYLSIVSTALIWKISTYLVSDSNCQHNKLIDKTDAYSTC